MIQALVFVVALLFVAEVSSLPGGAPAPACLTLSPSPAQQGGHGADPQTTPVPYMLGNFTETFYVDGGLAYIPNATYQCKSYIL